MNQDDKVKIEKIVKDRKTANQTFADKGSMEWHIHQALQSGATENQIMEAIEVGIEMGGGPATVFSRFALNVLEYHKSSNAFQR